MYYNYELLSSLFFFFNDTATTEIYTLSLHDALPIFDRLQSHHRPYHSRERPDHAHRRAGFRVGRRIRHQATIAGPDRKSTRLNSSHANISYAVFCLKKKKKKQEITYLINININMRT